MSRPPRGPNYETNPARHPGCPRPANEERTSGKRVHSEHYDTSIDLAARRHWPSWTCFGCPNYVESDDFPRVGAPPAVVKQRNLISRRTLIRRVLRVRA